MNVKAGVMLKPLDPLQYIASRLPTEETVRDVSSWFKNEVMELDFGEYIGRPSENITMHKSMLTYFFAQGWYVDEVLSSRSGGEWISVSSSEAQNSGTSSASSTGTSSTSGASQATSHTDSLTRDFGIGIARAEATGESSGTNSSSGESSSAGTNTSEATATITSTTGGAPYWYAYQRIRLKRRRIQPEFVLKDMIESFTKAYNEGREINNARYDELVSLYALMLRNTEDELNGMDVGSIDLQPLIDDLKAALEKALKDYRDAAGNLPADWMQSRIDEINRKFDALVGQTKAKMVSEGTYNATVWPTTLSGIERDRQYALNDLKDETVTLKIKAYGDIASITASVGQQLVDAQVRIFEAMQKKLLTPVEMRNTVFKWMLDFMERRDDDYPGLDQLVSVAERLGYGESAAATMPGD